MVRRLVVESAPVFRAASPVWLVAQVGATVDEDLAVSTSEGDRLRTPDYRQVVELAATKGKIKNALEVDAATDILVAMLSPTFYMELVKGRAGSTSAPSNGWPPRFPRFFAATHCPPKRRPATRPRASDITARSVSYSSCPSKPPSSSPPRSSG